MIMSNLCEKYACSLLSREQDEKDDGSHVCALNMKLQQEAG